MEHRFVALLKLFQLFRHGRCYHIDIHQILSDSVRTVNSRARLRLHSKPSEVIDISMIEQITIRFIAFTTVIGTLRIKKPFARKNDLCYYEAD
ncbi:MAG: hypothetical protein HGB15_06835 [Chlorobaculum sp.]|nr:hypothetical protein [Chlorobaculum sp.]